MKITNALSQLSLLMALFVTSGIQCTEPNCHCAISTSRYLTTAAVSTTTTTVRTTTKSEETSTAAGDWAATTERPTTETTVIRMTISSKLTMAFTELAFNQSTPGFGFENFTNQFTLPANGSVQPMVVIDLLIGPSGDLCRAMPQMEQICISSACASCNLLKYSSAAATTLMGGSAFTQRIVYLSTIDNSTNCVGRDAFQRFGDFRYLVLFPMENAPDSSKPFSFTVSISGNFSSYNCPTSRKRRSVGIQDDADSFFLQLARSRRAIPKDCICLPGQDPVFPNSRTVLISWKFPFKPFNKVLEDGKSDEYMTLARESYFLLIDSVRKPTSNLTSIIGNFFDISFTVAGSGTKLSGKLTVRNVSEISNEFLLAQLTLILPGVGWSIVGLTISSEATKSSKTSLPVYAVVLICLISLLVFATVLILTLWRLQVIGKLPTRQLAYKASEVTASTTSGINTTETVEISKWRLGASLDGAVQMPETAYQDYSALPPIAGAFASTQDPATAENDNFKAAYNERAV